jgi:uncharacterized repeat protein (TIGR02543 family)
MKNSYKRIFALLILFVSVLLFSTLTVTAADSCTPQTIQTDENVEIEAKYKKTSKTNKITFNANGGKIGSKKTQITNVKKGSAIKKFPTTPKRTGYTFKGWYTKKSSGKKIAVSAKPTKSITLYAQWTKKARVLNVEEKRLVGKWESTWDGRSVYQFSNDGSYIWVSQIGYFSFGRFVHSYDGGFKGTYSLKNGRLVTTWQHAKDYNGVGFSSKSLVWSKWETSTSTIKFDTVNGEQRMQINEGLWHRKVS